ncbi:MAG: hypothetical protein L6R41_007539, partial [Letrouitia leprolyta]
MVDFDYIVVGGGPAGSTLAKRLAEALPSRHVLLLEAGGPNNDKAHQTFGERHWTLIQPGYNWGYKTVSQPELDGREIDYSRGKGLGGSSCINFCVYTRGPSADYDQWAHLVGDDDWSWEKSKKRFNQFEKYHDAIPEYQDLVTASADTRGKEGPVDVGVAEAWDPGFGDFMRKAYHYYPKNGDHNSGDPIGIGVCQLSTHNGNRVTASGAYLASTPPNLSIKTNTTVARLVFEGKRVIGVDIGGETVRAKKEVILAGGAIDSPKLLLLSGIGPAQDLKSLNIPVVQDLPGVGKNLQDRLFLELVMVQDPRSHHRTSYIDSPAALEEARKEWVKTQSGPLSDYYLPQMIAYLKSDKIVSSKEFEDLDKPTQDFLRADTKPFFEIVSQNPSPSVKAPEKYLATATAFPGNHGTGSITLSSSDPKDLPIINPGFLSHPIDKRIAIESVRETLEFLNKPLMAEGSLRLAAGPEGSSDEEILTYVRKTAISMWHACGTVKMGKLSEPGTCVDKDFKLVGVQNLRVVDMSVAPFLP